MPMNKNRRDELLAYASVCFRNITSPFETSHLVKKNVKLDECGELSEIIADLLEDEVYDNELIESQEREFWETQE